MKNFICIGYEIPGHSEKFNAFSNPISLLDYDIVIIAPNFDYNYYEFHEGKPRYSDSSSFKVKEDSEHWAREIKYSMEAGKTVFVIMSQKDDFFIYTGRREFSGTGRNARQVNYVDSYNNYKFLSFASLHIQPTDGRVIEQPNSPVFRNFFSEFKDYLVYKNYITIEKCNPIFTTKTGNKVVGAVINHPNGGHLVFLPYINYDWESFTGKNKKGEAIWNKVSIIWGNKLIHCIMEIDKSLSSQTQKTPTPQWVSSADFILKPEIEIHSKITTTEVKISELNRELGEYRQEIEKVRELKYLLYETGKNLEYAVGKALGILGYKAENYNDGKLELDHVIFSPEGNRYIGECEGKDSASVDITKFRQLADEIHEDFERPETETEAFGLLFGNPQRLLPLNERTQDFTQKCVDGAKRKGYGLIKTADLFPVCKYILETDDQSFATLCRKHVHDSLGGLIKFPEIPKEKE